MEAAVLGAVFFLALFGPAYFGGYPFVMSAGDASAPWRIVLEIVGAAGVGAVLSLMGQAIWEFVTPYGSESGWRYLNKTRDEGDFRNRIASASTPEYGKLPYRADMSLARTITSIRWWPGHQTLIPTEFFFYRDAPDPILQWVRRRYDRFARSLSVTAAIVLGVVIGLVFLSGPELPRQLLFDAGLLVLAALTMFWAVEVRRQAQEMEAFWFAMKAKHVDDDPEETHVVFDQAVVVAQRN